MLPKVKMAVSTTRYIYYFLLTLTIACGLYVFSILYFFQMDLNEFDSLRRLPNIRLAPQSLRADIVKKSIDSISLKKKARILIIGDSQPFGHQVPTTLTFPYLINAECGNYDVINLSIVDGRFEDQSILLKYLSDNSNLTFDLVVTNVNPSHFSRRAEKLPNHFVVNEQNLITTIYMALKDDSLFFPKNIFNSDFWGKDMSFPSGFNSRAVDGSYYMDLDFKRKEGAFNDMLIKINKISKHKPMVYMSPRVITPYRDNGIAKTWNVEEFELDALMQCQRLVPGGCLDLVNSLPLSAFFDIVHFNDAGHRLFAKKLIAEFEKILPTSCN